MPSPDTLAGARRASPGALDPLTALAGRALLLDQIAGALSRTAGSGTTAAVLLLDIDRFKQLNDAYGYAAGDELLAAVAERLRGVSAAGDTLARTGGDRFAVLCDGIASEQDALALAARILDVLAVPFAVGERQVHVSGSVGVGVADIGVHTPESLVLDAEVAVHEAKAEGGARTILFDEPMRRRLLERAGLEQDLHAGLRRDEFALFYQPIVSLSERRIVAVEALVRWQHPRLGLVPPSAFLPVAEETGLVVELGQRVITQACRQLARWSGDPAVDLPLLSVNVSGRQLADPELPDVFADALRRTGADPSRLAVELTEGVLMSGTSSPTAVVQRLGELGLPLLLDDFGTGYSSLDHLRRFPISGVKVDRSFVGGIVREERDRHILSTILRLAEGLELDVIAEGVESVEQAHVLHGLGCTRVQGYLFSPPVAAGAMGALLHRGLPVARTSAAFTHPAATSAASPSPGAAPASAPPEDGPTVTLGEAAQALSVSVSTLRRWADAGRVRSVRTPGGHRRIPVAEVRRLNQESALAQGPAVRAIPLPTQPLPHLAALLDTEQGALGEHAARAVYVAGRLGWFASDAAQPRLVAFARTCARAAAAGDWPAVLAAGRDLGRHAHYAGASVLERHAFLERCADLAVRRLHDRKAPQAEMVGARRIFAALRRELLEDCGRA